MRYRNFIFLLIAAVFLLSGCNMTSVNDLYCLPKRSESYTNLQNEIDKVMEGLEYSAPISGEYQQTVQMADLDGDGQEEYLLFAKGSADNPLQIFVFSRTEDDYTLLGNIKSTGSSFQQVEYVDMDKEGGLEIIVGRQISDQVARSVSVYSLRNGQFEEILKTTYTNFVCTDMDIDSKKELLLLRQGEAETHNGVAELYNLENGVLERTAQASMSRPAENIMRIMVSRLHDGLPAVYVASDAGNDAIITDVYAEVRGVFRNVTFSNETGTSIQTLRSYYVFADDIDGDGTLELPHLIDSRLPEDTIQEQRQHIVRWYAMCSDGREADKQYTYHNFVGGWYLQLRNDLALRTAFVQKGSSYEMYLWDEDFTASQKLLTIHVLTGSKREEQATEQNRFVVLRTDTVVYAAELEVASATYGMSREGLINNFHLIVQDWNNGET
ncbi:MAG: hypothetical protein E7439_02800 [Ruminococcaceae bacterium]|nr:hypothetical protein [Oscillospiraceae bacterium]